MNWFAYDDATTAIAIKIANHAVDTAIRNVLSEPNEVDKTDKQDAGTERKNNGMFRVEIDNENDGKDIEERKNLKYSMGERENCGNNCTDKSCREDKQAQTFLIFFGQMFHVL